MLMRWFVAASLVLSAAACTAQPAPAADGGLVEGKDYALINPPVPTADASKIEVVEVFGYSCVHCAHLQPVVDAWKPKLASDVQFVYMPAVFGGVWEVYGRAFYAAETMGLLDKTHSALFNALHVERRPVRSVEDVAAFYADYGTTRRIHGGHAELRGERQDRPRSAGRAALWRGGHAEHDREWQVPRHVASTGRLPAYAGSG